LPGLLLYKNGALRGRLFCTERAGALFVPELRCLRGRASSTYEYTPPVPSPLSPCQTQKSPRLVGLVSGSAVRRLRASKKGSSKNGPLPGSCLVWRS